MGGSLARESSSLFLSQLNSISAMGDVLCFLVAGEAGVLLDRRRDVERSISLNWLTSLRDQ